MKYLIQIAVTLCWILISSHAGAVTFTIPEAKVSFDAPDGFTKLTKSEIAIKYPRATPPKYVFGNKSRITTIACELRDIPLQPSQLGEVKASFETNLPRVIPNLVWKENKILSMQNQDWLVLEMTSSALDTDIYNILLTTSRNGKMLLFNFNSSKEEFPKAETSLRNSIQSIKFK